MDRRIVEFDMDDDFEYFDITNLSEEEYSLYYDAYEYNENFGIRGARELKDEDYFVDDEFLSTVTITTLTSESVIDFVEGVVEGNRKILDDLSLRMKNIQEKKEELNNER